MIPNFYLDNGFGMYNQPGKNVPESLLIIGFGILFLELGVDFMNGRAVNGEDKLSKESIESGKLYMKSR